MEGSATDEPPQAKMDLDAGLGRKRGERTGTGTSAGTGTRCEAQGRAAEDGGWRVLAAPRWAAIHTWRGGGDQAKQEVFDDERLRMRRR